MEVIESEEWRRELDRAGFNTWCPGDDEDDEDDEEEKTGTKRTLETETANDEAVSDVEKQERAKEFLDWKLFKIDTDNTWHIANYITNPPFIGVVYVHKPTYRPIIIIRTPPIEGCIDITTYLVHSQCGEPQMLEEETVGIKMPMLMKEIEESYNEKGFLSREEGDDARITMMRDAGISMPHDEKPMEPSTPVDERRKVKAKNRNHTNADPLCSGVELEEIVIDEQ